MIYLSHYRHAASTHTDLIEDNQYPQRVHWFPDTYAKVKTGLKYPAHELANKVLDPELLAYVRDNPVPGKTGFILAGGSQAWGGLRGRADPPEDSPMTYRLKLPFVVLSNIFAGRIANQFGAVEHVSTDASACASSLKVLMDVQNLMTNFGFDRMIVLALEDVNHTTLEFFGQGKASLLHKDELEGMKPSAFDSVNHGFNVGQGVGLAVFESDRVAKTPVARFLGAYTAAEDFNNPLSMRPDGQGYVRAIEGALTVAGLSADAVKVVKTHGTGTLSNNVAERAALTSTLKDFVATSYKQRVGHTLAASGIMETGLLLDDIKSGIIPGIPNRTERDDVFLSAPVCAPSGVILSLAAGMGNVFSAALFSTTV